MVVHIYGHRVHACNKMQQRFHRLPVNYGNYQVLVTDYVSQDVGLCSEWGCDPKSFSISHLRA
uniref:Uncharacterized protein n=1 Tax=Arundo donax TaxID=35708 RepID=A0A0A9H874_ARUDO